jgi:glycerophosphoryl diester phosphodiesterase
MQTHTPVIVGHRGAKGIAPENTLAGFAKAIEVGVDMIETDIQMTKDNILILVHDPHVVSEERQRYIIRHSTYEELLQHDANIPTLEDAIRFVNKRARMMLEVKPGVPTGPIVACVNRLLDEGWSADDFMFNSANYTILKDFYDELPSVDRIIQGNWSGVRATYLAKKLHTPYILLDQRYLWWGFVKSVSKNYRLFTYTYPWFAREPYKHHKARKWFKYGLYGIVTDYPNEYTKDRKV